MQQQQKKRSVQSLRNNASTNSKHVAAFADVSHEFHNPDHIELEELKYTMHQHHSSRQSMPYLASFPYNFELSHPYVTLAEQLQQQIPPQFCYSLPLKSVAAEGMYIVCQVDMLILKNYYPLRAQVFEQANRENVKRMTNNTNSLDWIRERFNYRYQPKISNRLNLLVGEVNQIVQNKTEAEDQKIQINKLDFEAPEFVQLDIEMRNSREADFKDYLQPKELILRISQMIQLYFVPQQ